MSRFKILAETHNDDPGNDLEKRKKHDDPVEDTKSSHEKDENEWGKGNVEPCLDEDGDLDVTHRYEKQKLKINYYQFSSEYLGETY